MVKWLHTILAEIERVTEIQESFAEPDEEGRKHEHVVGIANSDLRKIFFLFKQYFRRSVEIKAALTVCGKSEREQLENDLRRFGTQAETLKEIFWTSCRTAYPELWNKPSIGIRKDWKIIWSEQIDGSEGLNILSALVGSGLFDEIFGTVMSDSFGPVPDKSKMN
jgi:hypothetical protein